MRLARWWKARCAAATFAGLPFQVPIAEACSAHGKLARGSAETEAQIEEYWRLGCKVLNLPGNDVSTYLDGLKARAGRAQARLKSIGVPTP